MEQKEKTYTLQLTEAEITTLVNMIQNENVELVHRVMEGQARMDTINKLTSVVQEEKINATNTKPKSS